MRRGITALVMVSVLLLASATSATPAVTDKPVRGTMDLEFNLAWPGYQEAIPDWVGTVTIRGEEYGMAFFLLDQAALGRLGFFYEKWVIYEELDFAFGEDGVLETFTPGDVLLSGHDRGMYNSATGRYHMTGTVEAAAGVFADRLGRWVWMRGIIELYPDLAPHYAPGIFRIL